MTTLDELSFTEMARAAQKATIMATMEMKREERPIISFTGNHVRNFFSAYSDVRIPRNVNTEVVAKKSEIESDTMKTMSRLSFNNVGIPLSLLPPGIVKAAANMMVTTRALTNELDVAISFIHLSPSFTKLACWSENTSLGVFPSEFTKAFQLRGTMLSTSYNNIMKIFEG